MHIQDRTYTAWMATAMILLILIAGVGIVIVCLIQVPCACLSGIAHPPPPPAKRLPQVPGLCWLGLWCLEVRALQGWAYRLVWWVGAGGQRPKTTNPLPVTPPPSQMPP